jgi:hypothetical protein
VLNDAVKASDSLIARAHVAQSMLRNHRSDELSEVAAQLATLVLVSREFGVSEGPS